MKQENRNDEVAVLERGAATDVSRIFKAWFLEIGSSTLIDDLTHFFNRRYLYHRLIQEIERARRSKGNLAVILFDVDNFKAINETYGYHRADEIFHVLAILLADNLRKSDIICRYGGDTLAVILPDTNVAGALIAIKRTQEKIKAHAFKTDKEGTLLTLTLSAGLVTYPEEKTSLGLLKRCLLSLNMAKAKGNNSYYHISDREVDSQQDLDFDVFVGREREMNFLIAKLQDGLQKKGDVIFISGEVGVGKTKLLLEIAKKAKEMGYTAIYTKTQSSGISYPYQPFIDAIKFYLREQRLSDGERFEKLFGLYAPQLAQFFQEVSKFIRGDVKPIVPEYGRQRLYEGIAQFFINLSHEAPLFLIIDDLQWASDSDIELIHFIARSVPQERFLLCCACRIDETRFFSLRFKDQISLIKNEGLGRELHLEVLSKDDSDRLVEKLLNDLNFPAELKGFVYNFTQGNPLHIIELTKSMLDEGIIRPKKGAWVYDSSADIDVEGFKSINSIIERRIAKLDGITDNVLSMSSVVGEVFTFDVIQRVSALNEGQLIEIFDRAVAVHLIAEMPGSIASNYVFCHSFIQNKFYSRLSAAKLHHFHSQIALALEKVYANRLIEVFGELGWHLSLIHISEPTRPY